MRLWVLVLGLALSASLAGAQETVVTAKARFTVETLAQGLEHPWSLVFLPDGRILVTERPGRLRLWSEQGLAAEPVEGLPAVVAYGQGGLLDVVLDPRFDRNGWVYLSYTFEDGLGLGTAVSRHRWDGRRLVEGRTLFRARPTSHSGRHFGGRLVFDREGYLYLTLGDRGRMTQAQALDTHYGSVVRLLPNGAVPSDNPFFARMGMRPEIFTYGHRNPQGLALQPQTGAIWLHEHGPRGGDELNLLQAGGNYGWPLVTHGVDYDGSRIGEGTTRDGVTPPVRVWVPSIAPSGMTFYDGDAFPAWQGSLFLGSLKDRMLVRLELEEESVTAEERLLQGVLGRIRDVRQGPDGLLYLLTDEIDGGLYRLRPDEPQR